MLFKPRGPIIPPTPSPDKPLSKGERIRLEKKRRREENNNNNGPIAPEDEPEYVAQVKAEQEKAENERILALLKKARKAAAKKNEDALLLIKQARTSEVSEELKAPEKSKKSKKTN